MRRINTNLIATWNDRSRWSKWRWRNIRLCAVRQLEGIKTWCNGRTRWIADRDERIPHCLKTLICKFADSTGFRVSGDCGWRLQGRRLGRLASNRGRCGRFRVGRFATRNWGWLGLRDRVSRRNRRPKGVNDPATGPTLEKLARVLGSLTEFICRDPMRRRVDGAQQRTAGGAENTLIIRRYFGGHVGLTMSTPHWASCRCEITETRFGTNSGI